jgi:hypothetical protein
MPTYSFPSIDVKNPLYCPSVSAAAYLDSLRRRLRRNRSRPNPYRKSTHNEYFLQSFARILDNALLSSDSDDEDTRAFPPQSRIKSSHPGQLSSDTNEAKTLGFEYAIPTWEYEDADDLSENLWVGIKGQPLPSKLPALQDLKRKRTSFSDIRGPAKHAKSFQSVQESSFDISVKHEKLRYSGFADLCPRPYLKTIEPSAESTPPVKHGQKSNDADSMELQFKLRIRALEGAQILKFDVTICGYIRGIDELYGSPIGTESPRGIKPLIDRLDYLFPGTRLKDRLLMSEDLSHQGIIDFLAIHGVYPSIFFRAWAEDYIRLPQRTRDGYI